MFQDGDDVRRHDYLGGDLYTALTAALNFPLPFEAANKVRVDIQQLAQCSHQYGTLWFCHTACSGSQLRQCCGIKATGTMPTPKPKVQKSASWCPTAQVGVRGHAFVDAGNTALLTSAPGVRLQDSVQRFFRDFRMSVVSVCGWASVLSSRPRMIFGVGLARQGADAGFGRTANASERDAFGTRLKAFVSEMPVPNMLQTANVFAVAACHFLPYATWHAACACSMKPLHAPNAFCCSMKLLVACPGTSHRNLHQHMSDCLTTTF